MTKDTVLAMLRREPGFVSGEGISSALGVSRMAVNMAIKSLRAEGYVIESSTKKGYCLISGPNALNPGELLGCLSPERMETVHCLDTVDSTNKYLKALAMEGAPAGTTVIADEQTGGRGRLGRSFASPKGTGIYFSYLLRPEAAPADTAVLTAWTAVAMARAIEKVSGFAPGIKWVNDLVWQGKKVCGILTEMAVEGETAQVQYIVVGIGVNVGQDAFDGELEQKAASLKMVTGKEISRAALAAEMLRQMDALGADFPKKAEEYLQAYREACVVPGREVMLVRRDEVLRGTALEVTEDFSLKVRFADGSVEDVSSGEVSVRGIYDGEKL